MQQPSEVSRRHFLRASTRTAAAAGVAASFPSLFLNRTLAATGENPSELVRVGVIGTGGRGRDNMKAIIKNVVAVCDVDKGHAAEAKQIADKANGINCTAYSDYRKLLDDKGIDAVLISTPDHWHALASIHACMAGKDVYCEKPLTLVVSEGRAMVQAARKYNRILQCGSQQRSDKKFRLACELVRNGRIGRVPTIRVGIPGVNWTSDPLTPDAEPPAELDYDKWLGPAPFRKYNKQRVHYYFRFFWNYSGGQMTNWGAHHLDIVQWALGMDESGPQEISGFARFDKNKRFETPSWFEINYTYKHPNHKAIHPVKHTRVVCGMSHRIGVTFEGEDGLIYVNRGVIEANSPDILTETLKASDERLIVSDNHYQNWLSAIKTRQKPICDVETGHRSATVCHLGSIAARLDRTFQWDPAKEQIAGDAEASSMLTYKYRDPYGMPDLA
jgi:predicted dehydrogenase